MNQCGHKWYPTHLKHKYLNHENKESEIVTRECVYCHTLDEVPKKLQRVKRIRSGYTYMAFGRVIQDVQIG